MAVSNLSSPYLKIEINNREYKGNSFFLHTSNRTFYTEAKLKVNKDITCVIGDAVKIYLGYRGEQEEIIYTGQIGAIQSKPVDNLLYLREWPGTFINKLINDSYSKESAKQILLDLLNEAGITEYNVECITTELNWFVVSNNIIATAILSLIQTINQYTDSENKINYFFDKNGCFRFGTIDDQGINPGSNYSFAEKQNIIQYLSNGVETFALPIRHSQKVIINDEEKITRETKLFISARKSRLELYW